MVSSLRAVPSIDVAALFDPGAHSTTLDAVAAELGAACESVGFFSIVNHGYDPGLRERLHRSAAAFFELPTETKDRIAMRRAGRAWRGWFPLGGELTSGVADMKEGIYFGEELTPDHERVAAGVPLHGANLFPPEVPELRAAVLAHMSAMTFLGRRLMEALGHYLDVYPAVIDELCVEPTVLFRIFRYPSTASDAELGGNVPGQWGVAEHTDYGLLTMLDQDDHGGLEVCIEGEWLTVEPDPDALVCNLGDMLERMTGGRFRSTRHRVRRPDHGERMSFPFFFDPAWNATIPRLGHPVTGDGGASRWDAQDPVAYAGTYGEYLLAKVRHVFPGLSHSIAP